MKILHFIRGKANPDRANGVNQVIHGLAKYLTREGNEVYVVGISSDMDSPREIIQRDGFQVEVFKSFSGGAYSRLRELCKTMDIVHLHGVWNHGNVILGRYLREISCPYVVTAHSGLAEDRLEQSNYWLKIFYNKLFQKKLYDGAAGIHAITREEISDISNYTENKNIFFVPNGIDLENIPYLYEPKETNVVKIAYLGRLSVEKNIINLIAMMADISSCIQEEVMLYLISPLSKKTEAFERQVKKLGLQDKVIFTGGLYGDEKINFLAKMDAYIHPAYSDVVSIAVMEAMGVGLPSVITRTSQVSYYFNSGAFIMVEPTRGELERGIMEIVEQKEKWKEMSVSARSLVVDVFNWEKVAKQMTNQYKKCIRKDYQKS